MPPQADVHLAIWIHHHAVPLHLTVEPLPQVHPPTFTRVPVHAGPLSLAAEVAALVSWTNHAARGSVTQMSAAWRYCAGIALPVARVGAVQAVGVNTVPLHLTIGPVALIHVAIIPAEDSMIVRLISPPQPEVAFCFQIMMLAVRNGF